MVRRVHISVMAMLLTSILHMEARAASLKPVRSTNNQTPQKPSERIGRFDKRLNFFNFRAKHPQRFLGNDKLQSEKLITDFPDKFGPQNEHKIRHAAHLLRKMFGRNRRLKRHIDMEPIPAIQDIATSGWFPDEIPTSNSKSLWQKWPRHKQY